MDFSIIKKLRIEKGLTKAELSRQTGISQQLLCDIEGKRRNPSLFSLIKLAKCLNFSLDKILLNLNAENSEQRSKTEFSTLSKTKGMGNLRRFRYITDDETKRDKFNELVDSKNLSREDLVLILTCISLNFDIFPQGSIEKILGIQGL